MTRPAYGPSQHHIAQDVFVCRARQRPAQKRSKVAVPVCQELAAASARSRLSVGLDEHPE